MDNLNSFFSRLVQQASGFWGGLNLAKKIILGAIVTTILIAITTVVLVNQGEPYDYLFVNLSDDDIHDIAASLKKSGLKDFVIDNKGIKVPASKVIPYRLKLTQEGLPTHGSVGWEKFDNPDFRQTEFDRNINKIRAIQGELARTIESIDGISSVRVHIVVPKQALFEEDKKEPTAAVYIKTKRGVKLTSKQIGGIVHLVSKSVEGMQPENISIIDFEGKLLTEEQTKDPTAKETKHFMEYKRNYERRLEEKVRAIVGRIVGQDRVEAKVNVDMDFTKEEQTISDLDPEKTVVVSQKTLNQKTAGTGLNPTGIPGSKSNVPGEQEALNLTTSKAENQSDSELINYEVPKIITHKVLPISKIKRISAAVIVDGKQPLTTTGQKSEFEPRTPEEMKKIEELVKSAIGYVDGRDEVKVHNMQFQLDYIQEQVISEETQKNWENTITLAMTAVVALALVLFFVFIVRPYFHWLSYDPERKQREKIVEEFKPDLELTGIQNVQVKEDVPFDKLTPQEQVLYIAKHEPQRTTEAIRMILNPHQSGI